MFVTLTARLRLLTFALALPVFVAGLAHPTWAKTAGIDVWNVPTLREQIRTLAGENDRLDAAEDEVQRRMAVKEALVAELVAGRTTLAAVTAQFVEMNAGRPNYVAAIRASFPGGTDQEKAARNVIEYALARTAAANQAAVAGRLEAELRQMTAPAPAH